jgi:hypothetical protein
VGFLFDLVSGDEAIDQKVSNLLACAVPAQSIALYAGSKAVRRVFASPFASLDDVVDFPRAFLMLCFSIAAKNKRISTEMTMPSGAIKYVRKLTIGKHHSLLWDNTKVTGSQIYRRPGGPTRSLVQYYPKTLFLIRTILCHLSKIDF